MRPSLVVRRTLTVVAFVAGAWLGAAAVSSMMSPRFEVDRAGEHLVIGGFSVPTEGFPDELDDTELGPGTVVTAVQVTNTSPFEVRVGHPRPLAVSSGADVDVAWAEPDMFGIGHGPAAVQVAPGETFTVWVTIAQRACAPGLTSHIERGVRGVAVSVTAWGATRTEVLDIDLAAYAETVGGVLPQCT